MKHLFIDSNVWLSLYYFTSDDLNQFSKLKDRLGDEIRLYVPQQVKDEISRNREAKLKDTFKDFDMKKQKYPAFCKAYEEYEAFNKDYTELLKRFNGWKTKITEDIQNENLPADNVIQDLIQEAGVIPCDDYVSAAYNRYRIGNPPGKDNKYGDAINWECLLYNVPKGEDIYFISMDQDYRSQLFDNQFNPFLKDEWNSKKNGKVIFYQNLISFLREHIKEITLKTEEEKQKLIDQLASSGSFIMTHGTIAMLSNYTGWTTDQIEKLCSISEENDQVGLILSDFDVMDFYSKLVGNLDYEKLEESATKRMMWNLFRDIIGMENYMEAKVDYDAEVMDALENNYRH